MDRIAVISDIHGNLTALLAVQQDIELRGISRVFCLGDLIGKGPHPEAVVDWVKERCEIVIQGNWDDFMAYQTDNPDILWHQQRLGPDRLAFLSELPFSIDFWMSGKYIRLFHASPESIYTRIQPWDTMERRMTMFQSTERTGRTKHGEQPDVVGYGDVHNAYVQHFPGKMIFNTGSVGNPLEIPQASYAILEGTFDSELTAPFSITLVRVPYDIEEEVRIATEEGMPQLEPYVQELRTARYRGLKRQG